MLEQIINLRIEKIAENYLLNSHYGFWNGRYTLDVINLVVTTASETITGNR